MTRLGLSSALVPALLLLLPFTLAPGPPAGGTVSPAPVLPPDGTGALAPPTAVPTLVPGVVITNTLDVESPMLDNGAYSDRYDVTVLPGQTYGVWVASDDFDTVLSVVGPTGEPIASDDDGYFGTNSRLTFNAEAAATYQVIVTSYSPGATGTFRLLLTIGGAYSPSTTPLPIGPMAASLDETDPIGLETGWQTDYYLLTPVGLGEPVTLTLRSAAFDAMLSVVDSDGRILMSDDNSAGGRDAMLSFPWTPAPGQQFYAVVTSAEPDQFGGYFLERSAAPPAATPPAIAAPPTAPPPTTAPPTAPPAGPAALLFGETLSGRLEPSDSAGRRPGSVDAYRVSVASDMLVQLDATSSDFDTFLQLYDERGDLIGEDDDGGRRTNSRLVADVPRGEYVAEVSSFDGEGTGEYELRLTEAELLTEPESIGVGDEIDGQWTVRHPLDELGHRIAYYTFRPRRDGGLTILLRPRDDRAFCTLEMADDRGRIEERSILIDDGCVIVADVRSSETYDLRAIGTRHEDDMGYMLALSAQDPAMRWDSIDLNHDVRGHVAWSSHFTEWNAPGAGFTFSLTEGDRVTVFVRNTELDARVYVSDMAGTLIASSMDSRNLDSGSGLRFTAPHTGWYRLVVTGRQRWFDTFTLRVNRSPGP